jgi:synaptobrevin family protein YKT6
MAKEHINFNSRMIASRIPPGNKASVTLENDIGICYCYTTKDNLSATVIADKEYPEKAAFILLNNVLMDFREYFASNPSVYTDAQQDANLNYENLEVFLKKWQDPTKADKLLGIEKELHEVKEIIHKNLADLLKKGEQLDELMVKSKDLNKVSVEFYKKAKKQNQRCCNLQ